MGSLRLVVGSLPNIQSCTFKVLHVRSMRIPSYDERRGGFQLSVCRFHCAKDQARPAPSVLPADCVGMATCAMAVCTCPARSLMADTSLARSLV